MYQYAMLSMCYKWLYH